MQMVDKAGNLVDVPDEKAGEAFRSGELGFQKGARIPVAGDDGKVGTIGAEDASDAFASSDLNTVSRDAFHAAEQENKYGGIGGKAAAFGIGAGDALALGFGKGLAVKGAGVLGGQTAEDRARAAIQGYTEQNPGFETAGQVVGTAAPLLVGGVEGLVGKGARGVGAGVRGVDAIGGLAERGAATLVGTEATGVLGKAAQRGAALGARGAAEGSIYGAGGAFSESVLKNEDLTAERIMSGAAHGALVGGTIGAGLGAGASLTESAVQKLADTIVPKIRESVEEFAQQRAVKAAGGTKVWVKKAMNRAGGAEEIGKDLLERGHIKVSSTIDSIADSISKDADEQGAKLGSMMRDLDAAATSTEGGKLVNGSKIVERAYKEVVQPLLDNPAMRDVGEQMASRLAPYVDDFAGKEVGHLKLWDIRKGLDKRINWETRAQSPLADGLKDFRRIMEGELMESADAEAARLGVSNTFGKDWQETKRLYSSLAFSRDMAEDAIARKEGNRFFSLTDNLAGGFGAAASAVHAIGDETGHLGALSLLNPKAAIGGLLTAAAHKVARERGSAVAASVAHQLSQIGSVTGEAMAVERSVSEAVDKFIGKGAGVMAPVEAKSAGVEAVTPHREPARALVEAASNVFGHDTPKGSLDERYQRATAAVAHLSSNPVAAQAHLQSATAHIAPNAPGVALKIAIKQGGAVRFLASKLPPSGISAPLSTQHVRTISDMDKAGFLRTLKAVQRPLSVVEDMKDGKLSREGVEALKVVYPETYADLRTKVLDRVTALVAEGKGPSYEQKLQIGILFDAPVDPTQAPDVVAAVKKIYASMGNVQSPDAGGQPGQSRGGTSRKVDTAGALETMTQRLEGRNG